jgi:hypothetical protein
LSGILGEILGRLESNGAQVGQELEILKKSPPIYNLPSHLKSFMENQAESRRIQKSENRLDLMK